MKHHYRFSYALTISLAGWLLLLGTTLGTSQEIFGENPQNITYGSPPLVLVMNAGPGTCSMTNYTGWYYGRSSAEDIPTSGMACTVMTIIPGSQNTSCGIYTEQKKTMTTLECQSFCNAMQDFCPYKQIRQAEKAGPTFDFSNSSPCGRAKRLADYCVADLAQHPEKEKFKGDCSALSRRATDICSRDSKVRRPPYSPITNETNTAVVNVPAPRDEAVAVNAPKEPADEAVAVNLKNSSPSEPPFHIVPNKPPSSATLGPGSPCGQVLRAQDTCKSICGAVKKPEDQAICLKDCGSLKADIDKLCTFGGKEKPKPTVAAVSPGVKDKKSKTDAAVCRNCSAAKSAGVGKESASPRRAETAKSIEQKSKSTSRRVESESRGAGSQNTSTRSLSAGSGSGASQTRSHSLGVQNSGGGSQTRSFSVGVPNSGGTSATSPSRPK